MSGTHTSHPYGIYVYIYVCDLKASRIWPFRGCDSAEKLAPALTVPLPSPLLAIGQGLDVPRCPTVSKFKWPGGLILEIATVT